MTPTGINELTSQFPHLAIAVCTAMLLTVPSHCPRQYLHNIINQRNLLAVVCLILFYLLTCINISSEVTIYQSPLLSIACKIDITEEQSYNDRLPQRQPWHHQWQQTHGRNSVTAWPVVPVLQVTIVPVPIRRVSSQPLRFFAENKLMSW